MLFSRPKEQLRKYDELINGRKRVAPAPQHIASTPEGKPSPGCAHDMT
jgi:hypothetical protein